MPNIYAYVILSIVCGTNRSLRETKDAYLVKSVCMLCTCGCVCVHLVSVCIFFCLSPLRLEGGIGGLRGGSFVMRVRYVIILAKCSSVYVS